MKATMRAKMRVNSVHKTEHSEELKMSVVGRDDPYPDDGSDENNTYAKFSPMGELSLTVANEALFGKIQPGDSFYLDFIKAEKPDPSDQE